MQRVSCEPYMKKIVAIYHSGTGNTKKAAEKIAELLSKYYNTQLFSVENLPESFNLNDYDGIVIGFPVIHTHPTLRILNFIKNIESPSTLKPAYIFTTCAWYSANTLRIFAKQCIKKNITPILHRVFRGCPASDGSLLLPFIKRFFVFSKNFNKKIFDDVRTFHEKIESGNIDIKMPRFKLYSIINYPNKLVGHLITFPIFVHKDVCTTCGKCIDHCPAKALEKDENAYPVFISKRCEKCYRCIHHCPKLALSLSKRKTPKKVLSYNL